jgi:hypothetical protein
LRSSLCRVKASVNTLDGAFKLLQFDYIVESMTAAAEEWAAMNVNVVAAPKQQGMQ